MYIHIYTFTYTYKITHMYNHMYIYIHTYAYLYTTKWNKWASLEDHSEWNKFHPAHVVSLQGGAIGAP